VGVRRPLAKRPRLGYAASVPGPRMPRPAPAIAACLSFALGGCEIIASFDRDRIVEEAPDVGVLLTGDGAVLGGGRDAAVLDSGLFDGATAAPDDDGGLEDASDDAAADDAGQADPDADVLDASDDAAAGDAGMDAGDDAGVADGGGGVTDASDIDATSG
jgi:hypothetical protein